MFSRKKTPKSISLVLLLCATIISSFIILHRVRVYNNSIVYLPSPTPNPIPSNWQLYINEDYNLSLRYPGEHFSHGSYPNLSFPGLVHQQGFDIGKLNTQNRLFSTLWTTLHVISKTSSDMDTTNWFLNSIGYYGDVNQLPVGDIFYAYNQSSGQSSSFPAVNMGGLVHSQFLTSSGIKQYGLSGGGYFIYSSLLNPPSSPYLAILSIVIPVKNPSDQNNWQQVFSSALDNYQLMLQSFTWL